MRLFIAVCFNNETKDQLCGTMQRLKTHLLRGNFTKRENLHLTLVFIGETPNVSDVKRSMDEINAKKFDLTIGSLGKFRNTGSFIYWLGIRENPTLSSIHHQLCYALKKAGFSIDTRPYKPHLTLSRKSVPKNEFQEDSFSASIPDVNIHVSKISLMKSERINGKLIYTEIYQKAFS